jgi:argininosuccinate lyase
VEACLQLAAPLVAGSEILREVVSQRIEEGFLDATTLMEYFIGRGVPMRTAHHLVGKLVAAAKERHATLSELPLEVYQAEFPDLDAGIFDVLGVANAIQAFTSYGSTAPDQVRRQVDGWRSQLQIGK